MGDLCWIREMKSVIMKKSADAGREKMKKKYQALKYLLGFLIGVFLIMGRKVPVEAASTRTIGVGESTVLSIPFSLSELDSGALGGSHVWFSSNSNVAKAVSLGSTCRVTGVSAGTCIVYCDRASYAIKVTGRSSGNGSVSPAKPRVVKAKKITLNKKKLTLKKGKSAVLTCRISPSNAKKKVTWKSSKPGIVSVDKKGKIKAKKAGTATITVRASSGVSAKCKVTVYEPIKKITLKDKTITLLKGKSKKLSYSVSPRGAVGSVTWKSSKPSVVSVTTKGKIKAKKAGSAVITVKASSGAYGKCKVTVYGKPKAVRLNSTSLRLDVGKSYQLKHSFSPKGSREKYSWKSSNSGIVKVDSNGKVTAVNRGTATITIKTASGIRAQCKIQVLVPVKDVKISGSQNLTVGNKTKFSYRAFPSNTTEKLTWISKNPSIASVDLYGNVTAKSPGQTYIGIKTNTNSYLLLVTVKEKIKSIQITSTCSLVSAGKTLPLRCVSKVPAGQTLSKVSWTSSNPSVAGVNASGIVSGRKQGIAEIQASFEGMKASMRIMVTKGAWADVSKGSIEIFANYFEQEHVKTPYDPLTGITLIQSSKEADGYVRIGYSDYPDTVYLILGGIQAVLDFGKSNAVVEMMDGSANKVNSLCLQSDKSLAVQGHGRLTAACYGPALRGGDIVIREGEIRAITESPYESAVLAYQSFDILEGAHVTCVENAEFKVDESYLPLMKAGRLTREDSQIRK